MDRVALLRAGYATLGLSLAAFGASLVVGALVFVGIVLGLVGGVLLALSGDDLPRWSGLSLVLYFLLTFGAFVAATPVTVRLEFFSGFLNDRPSPFASQVFDYLVLVLPVMIAATALAAAWEREWTPRLLLGGSVAGFALVIVLTLVLEPPGPELPEEGAEPEDPAVAARRASEAAEAAQMQSNLVRALMGVSAAAGSLGAFWASGRPDEYG